MYLSDFKIIREKILDVAEIIEENFGDVIVTEHDHTFLFENEYFFLIYWKGQCKWELYYNIHGNIWYDLNETDMNIKEFIICYGNRAKEYKLNLE